MGGHQQISSFFFRFTGAQMHHTKRVNILTAPKVRKEETWLFVRV
jgi:hypothetical protein